MLRQWMSTGIRTFCAVLTVCGETFEPVVCIGDSMIPTLHTNDVVLVNHLAQVQNGQIRKGDVVAAHNPHSGLAVCKRIIAVVRIIKFISVNLQLSPLVGRRTYRRRQSWTDCAAGTCMAGR